MRRSATSLLRSLGSRSFSSPATSALQEKIIAAVLFERLPVVIPKIDPVVYAFQEFSLRWGQQYRRKYPDEVLGRGEARGKGDYQIDYVPAPRITEADKTNDQKEHSIEGYIFSYMVARMELLTRNLFGTFLKKFMKMKIH
ncbi:hypothetical protein MA16_Dca010610 [Dendrobium catenatum]|uniref:Uncharacterized protein n=1 Tax=Dendrobium catenatum TaxID=906689 RepID=A0A2I0VZN3_9ASPA|nr:hypothetical protein MA16_Dca010610 [Dendrobium catenatum]